MPMRSCELERFSYGVKTEGLVIVGEIIVEESKAPEVRKRRNEMLRHSRRNTNAAIIVGSSAPASNPIGRMALSKKRFSSA